MMSGATSEKGDDTPLVYAITPETPFTPSLDLNVSLYKIGSVLKKTESRYVEYKNGGGKYPTLILPSHVRKYGSAFLNSGGGKLCIGVADDGMVTGIRLPTYCAREQIRKIIKDEFLKFTPPVNEDLYEIRYVQCNVPYLYVLEISIRAGNSSEIYSDGENKMYYKRDGSVEGPLWPRKIKDIVTSKFLKSLTKEDCSM